MLRTLWIILLLPLIGQAQNTFTLYNTGNSPLLDNSIWALEVGPDSAVWLGTDWGVYKIKDSIWTLYTTSNSNLPGDQIRSIAFDDEQNLWVGTFTKGFGVLRDTGWTVYNSSNSPLPDNHIKSIAFDTSGLAWIGSIAGASTFDGNNWVTYADTNTILTVPNIAKIFVEKDNTVYLGTVNGGLAAVRDTGWTLYQINTSGLPDNTVLDIASDQNGILWMAQPAAGATAFDGNSWFNFNRFSSSNPSSSLRSLSFDKNDDLYFGSLDKGLIAYKNRVDWSNYTTLLNPDVNGVFLPEDQIYATVVDPYGNIWIGTASQGLVRFSDEFISVITDFQNQDITTYPNPFTEHFRIRYPNSLNVRFLTISDITGKLVYEKSAPLDQSVHIPSNLVKGIYILQLFDYDNTLIGITPIKKG